jgi:very-short-patch-repair endonuclease
MTSPNDRDVTKRRAGATARARRLRREETDAERVLWRRLSGRELAGYKFVRQMPIGPYIVDFLCRAERLIVEIDGEQHVEHVRDETRTAWLNRSGYAVLRFWNFEVLREREAVLDAILAVLERRIDFSEHELRLSPASRGAAPLPCPAPRRGDGTLTPTASAISSTARDPRLPAGISPKDAEHVGRGPEGCDIRSATISVPSPLRGEGQGEGAPAADGHQERPAAGEGAA